MITFIAMHKRRFNSRESALSVADNQSKELPNE